MATYIQPNKFGKSIYQILDRAVPPRLSKLKHKSFSPIFSVV